MSENYNQRYFKNNLWVLIGHIFVYAKGIILLPILIKNLGVGTYGAYTLIMSYMTILFGISSLGINFKYSRFMPSLQSDNISEKKDLFYFQFLIHLFFVCIIFFVLLIFNESFKLIFLSGTISYHSTLLGIILFSNFIFHQSTNYFRYTHRLKYTSITSAISPYIFIAIIFFGLHSTKVDINFLLVSFNLSYLVLGIPLLLLIYHEIGFGIPRFSFTRFFNEIKLGIPLILVLIVEFLLSSGDRFVIAYFMDSDAVGYYSAAYSLGALVIVVPKIFGVSLPQVLALASDKGDIDEIKVMIEKTIKFFLIICIPFIVGSAILGKALLSLLTTQEVADKSYFITPIIAIGVLFYGLNYILANTVFYLKMKNNMIFYSNIIATVLNILLNIIFIYLFKDILVAAITTFISYFIAFVFLNYNSQKLINIKYYQYLIYKIIVASCIMGIYIYIIINIFIIDLSIIIFGIFSSIIVYISLVIIMNVLDKQEISFIYKFYKNILSKR